MGCGLFAITGGEGCESVAQPCSELAIAALSSDTSRGFLSECMGESLLCGRMRSHLFGRA
ncbi:hypothetical protein CKY39_19505 [Variovorax boronicumulans]|uniref:Uncharacterized protein n=1 Tax=Variovorax boronicumulans TaxID=436515 RepID=A0A250DLZ1_9BURK|nr:hypothetical protein CKY39_19505 [Variovorax boronicumulans]